MVVMMRVVRAHKRGALKRPHVLLVKGAVVLSKQCSARLHVTARQVKKKGLLKKKKGMTLVAFLV